MRARNKIHECRERICKWHRANSTVINAEEFAASCLEAHMYTINRAKKSCANTCFKPEEELVALQ